jgi:hypothetical protein
MVQQFFWRYTYLVRAKDGSYIVLWNWYHQHDRVFDWQHICYLWWTCVSIDSWHPYGYKLCSSSLRLVPLFVWGRLHTDASKEKRSFNFTFRYIDDVLSLNNLRFGDFVDCIYPIALKIKDTTDTYTDRSAPYLDLHLEIDSEGWLRTKLYEKGDDFNFPIVNIPFICSNIPTAPAYGVYISQLIRYSRACGFYQDFLDRVLLLTRKLLNQGFLLIMLKSSLWNVTIATMTWLTIMECLGHKWPWICSTCRKHIPVLSSFITGFTGFVARLTRRVSLMEQKLITLQVHLNSPPVFSEVRFIRSLVLYVYFVDRCLPFCAFSFGDCVVCSSSIYRLWWPLWYLQTFLIGMMTTVCWAKAKVQKLDNKESQAINRK